MLMLVGFLVSLPIGVWLLAAVCTVVDEPNPIPAIIRLIGSVCVILLVMLATDRTLIVPFGAALMTVTLLHLFGFWALRHFCLGVPVIQRKPIPLNDHALSEDEGDLNTRPDQI